MDQGAYLALAAALTVLGAIWTWVAFRRRGLGSGVRALGWTLLAPAAYLTGILRAGSRIVDALADWAARLVFSPMVWAGFGLAALAIDTATGEVTDDVLLGAETALYDSANLDVAVAGGEAWVSSFKADRVYRVPLP